MAEGGFEPYHVPQQSRRDKLRVVASHNQLPLQGCAAGLVPVLDPVIISSDLITCAGPGGLHHHTSSLFSQTPNPASGDAKEEGSNFMGYMGGGMIGASASSPATNHLYVDTQASVQLNPSPIQDISGSPFFYNPQSLRFIEQSFHGGEVMVYRPEPVSVGHGPNANDHTDSSNNNNSNKCGQGLSLSLSSHHSQQTSLPLELNIQRYDSSMYSAKVASTGGCFFPGAGDGSTSNELLSRSSVPLGPFTGYASILKGSRFLKPAQQLLEELCDVGRGVYCDKMVATDSILLDQSLECFSGTGSGTDDDPRISCRNGGENDTRKKKSRLISMLNEVYRRYKQYYQQMQAVISSFETVAGVRNAAPFATLALKVMSKHFRCLKNAITEQLRLMIESRGHMITNEKDAAPGFDNLGTGIPSPRPPQNTAFAEHHQPVWRPQRGLPERAVAVLRSWLFEHFLHPYPTDTDKLMLAKQTGLSRNQVSNWFINARVRLWKPMVEEIHMLETRQSEKGSQREEQTGDGQNHDHPVPSSVPNASENASFTPTKRCRELGGLKRARNDLTVIPSGNENHVMNLSYENSSSYVPSGGGFGVSKAGGGGGVSLTLGLYQNNAHGNLGLADPYPVNAARRFGLDANGEGYGVITPNRAFGREIVGGQLLHDFVG